MSQVNKKDGCLEQVLGTRMILQGYTTTRSYSNLVASDELFPGHEGMGVGRECDQSVMSILMILNNFTKKQL